MAGLSLGAWAVLLKEDGLAWRAKPFDREVIEAAVKGLGG